MEELEMMEQQAEEVMDETTEIEPITEDSDENGQKHELTAGEAVVGAVVIVSVAYAGYKAGKYIVTKALVPLSKKGVSKVKSLFDRKHSNPKIVETDATETTVEDVENSESDET